MREIRITRIGKSSLQRKIEFTSWLVMGIMLLASSFFASRDFTLGLLAGGLISILNFYGLCWGLQKAFGQWEADNKLSKAPFIVKYLLRMAAIGLVLYVLLALLPPFFYCGSKQYNLYIKVRPSNFTHV